jgi:hypothetical protein
MSQSHASCIYSLRAQEHSNNSDDAGAPPYDAHYNDDAPDMVACPPHTTERKLITKIDLHVIPFLCIMYLLAFLDRVNIANANV